MLALYERAKRAREAWDCSTTLVGSRPKLRGGGVLVPVHVLLQAGIKRRRRSTPGSIPAGKADFPPLR